MVKSPVSSEDRLTLAVANWGVYEDYSQDIKDLLRKNIEWKRFNELILYHELAPFAHNLFEKNLFLLPAEEVEFLKKYFYLYLTHVSYLWKEFLKIAQAFNDRNIDFLPLKGIAFIINNLYQDRAYLRPMCDMDLLVRREELALAEDAIEALGFRKNLHGVKEDFWRNKSYHLAFLKEEGGIPCTVEIHWGLDYKRSKPVLPGLWDRAQRLKVEGIDISMLTPEDTLLSLALHHRRPGKALCLKNVCDVAVLLNKYNDEINWDYILKEAETGLMRTALYFILTQAGLLLGADYPGSVVKNLNLPEYKEKLIKKFILENTFLPETGFKYVRRLSLKSHLLSYDNLREPLRYILDIPQEQFAKFYGLPAYANKTDLFYRIRYLYFLKDFFINMVGAR